MDRRDRTEMRLARLGDVSRRLALLALREALPDPRRELCLKIGSLIKEAQGELGQLENFMRSHEGLITAQVTLLEAAILATNLRPGEALETAQTGVDSFLESMGDRHR
ncbi:hypothetical protein [Rufibacter hautae]|uniref:Uncharacterized protein n=1 Tax=Rufibacter hautae TaxID=2595005 RepID=A0A5B6TB73_9BACT|nr:hypothetical protein [Rufibacter hautae]KAA3437115.1 hypothetical protein FOA19_22380 [Rufibacter hautae]